MSNSRLFPKRCALICLAPLLLTACHKDEQESHEDIIRADLAEIVSLQGLPCGKVVAHTLDERLDYRVECENGVVYRIHVTPEGHTKVREHTE